MKERELTANVPYLSDDYPVQNYKLSENGAHRQHVGKTGIFTVEVFLKLHHDMNLKYPKLPCIICQDRLGQYYIPLENIGVYGVLSQTV